MDFLFFALSGVLGGVLGGMGMGGGTVLIPLLSIVLGVEQHVAQAVNLVAFIPLSFISLAIHIKNGFVKIKDVFITACVGVPFCIFGAFIASKTDAFALKKCFGAFLLLLAAIYLFATLKNLPKKK